jgi:hypothetical protein
MLWFKDHANPICPPSLEFSLALPSTFTYADKTYVGCLDKELVEMILTTHSVSPFPQPSMSSCLVSLALLQPLMYVFFIPLILFKSHLCPKPSIL